MANDRAKELARKQKAEAKALKAAKRNSADPRDWGTWRQLVYTYRLTAEVDKPLPWLLAAVFLLPVALFTALGLLVLQSWWFWLLIGILAGLSLAMLLLGRRAKAAAYTRYEGQPGSGQVALGELNSKKWFPDYAIAVDRQQNVIHRVVGPGGLLLVGEGPHPQRLLSTETRRHQQVLYNVDVRTYVIGDHDGEVPLRQLAGTIKKLPATLDGKQIEEIRYRLKALDSMRAKIPVPKGPLPTSVKDARRMARGR